jgi:tetratricopeptide (TPR) repeat protein
MLKKAIVVILTLIAVSFSLYSAPANQGASNKFPWRKTWDRHHLYRMAIFYFEAGDAYEKKGKNEKAMYCYKHANNVSPYSDVGAKARNKLRTKFNQTPKEPTLDETVIWLKKQPDLTAEEKKFIEVYENRQNRNQTPEAGAAVPSSEGSTSGQSNSAATSFSSANQGGSAHQGGSTAEPSGGASTVSPPASENPQEAITDEEIRQRGSRLDYRDDARQNSGN